MKKDTPKIQRFCLACLCCCLLMACASDHSNEPKPQGTQPLESQGADALPNGPVSPPSVDEKLVPGHVMEENLAGNTDSLNGNVVSPVMIRQVQAWLNTLRFKAGAPDGKMGGQTVQAIKAYQKSRGLPGDGDVTKALWDRLHREVQKK